VSKSNFSEQKHAKFTAWNSVLLDKFCSVLNKKLGNVFLEIIQINFANGSEKIGRKTLAWNQWFFFSFFFPIL
jgi:hypothetical protein